MEIFKKGALVLIALAFLAWPIFSYICYIWAGKRSKADYLVGLTTAGLFIFKIFLIVLFIFSLICGIIYLIKS